MIFDCDYSVEEANIVLLPVPWQGTVSYGVGTAEAPKGIQKASLQVDTYDRHFGDINAFKIAMADEIQFAGISINQESNALNDKVYRTSKSLIEAGKIVGVVGGEHSVPYGLLKALSETHESFGIFHVDAHMDLRDAYQSHTHSHASIMFNIMKDFGNVEKLIQVGIRDFCEEELDLAKSNPKIFSYDDQCQPLTEARQRHFLELPKNVYVSMDIDGLDPSLCPNTGTPVPGGLSFNQVCYMLNELKRIGKRIIGFDLCEVGPTEWDCNVGARILFKLCGLAGATNQL